MSSESPKGGGKPAKTRTCDVCKYRHQRCSGDSPRCHHCELAGLECAYSTKPARLIDSSVTRRFLPSSSGSGPPGSGRPPKNRAVRSNPSGSSSPPLTTQAYEKLKKQLVEDVLSSSNIAGETRERLQYLLQTRFDERLEESSPYVQSFQSEPRFASELSFVQFTSRLLQGGSNETTDSLSSYIDDQEDSREDQSFLEHQPPIEVLSPSSFPTIEYTRLLVRAFNKLVNSYLFIYTEQDTEALLKSVYEGLQSAPRTAICELCMIFALGDQASNKETRSLSIFWFDNARRYLDEILNDSGRAAMWTYRVYLMVAIYYLSRKRNAARHYVELAVGLVRGNPRLLQVNKEPYLGRTLVVLDRYLSIFLGRRCLIPAMEASTYMQKPTSIPEDPLQSMPERFASLCFVCGQILEEVYGSQQIRYNVYEGYLHQLDAWEKSLPADLEKTTQFSSPPSSTGMVSEDFELQALIARLACLTAKILLSRPLLLQSVMAAQGPTEQPSRSSPPALGLVKKFSDLCVESAMDYLRISYMHLTNKALPLGCWFLIHGTFNAFLVVLLDGLQQEKLKREQLQRSGNSNRTKLMISTSLELLQYHSKTNEAAALYLKVSRSLNRALERSLRGGDNVFVNGESQPMSEASPPQPDGRLQYGWPEQHSGLDMEQPVQFNERSLGLHIDTNAQPYDYGMYRGDQFDPSLDNMDSSGYPQSNTTSSWQSPAFSMDESIDPSLLNS